MRLIRPATPAQIDLALLVIRLAVGAVFVGHGGQKIFVHGLEGVGNGFAQMGVPLAAVTGPLVGLTEFLGGIALIAGALTRLAALGTAVVMLGAIALVHLPNGFMGSGGMEFPLALFAGSVALLLTGGGAYSVDARLAGSRAR